MVDLQAVNAKLIKRSEGILTQLTGRSREAVHDALARTRGNVKAALLVLEGCDPGEAAQLLDRAGGHLRAAKDLARSQRPAKSRA
jgi:N-acetylmuramic acid 6-phosphate etherase